MTASFEPLLAPIGTVEIVPIAATGLRRRIRLTAVALGQALLAVPALALAVLSAVMVPLTVIMVGFGLMDIVVPLDARLAALHRNLSNRLLGTRPSRTTYRDTSGLGPVARPLAWLREPDRWRDIGFTWFCGSAGLALSAAVPGLLIAPVVHLLGLILDGGTTWWVLLVALDLPLLALWWLATPWLVRARARADRHLLDTSRRAELHERIEHVSRTRSETLDHSAAEIRRIERDLHDGAQARIAAVAMNVGLAEKLIASDPAAATALLRETRNTSVSALEDLRSVVRGILPPVLADRGLVGGIEAVAIAIPFPVAVDLAVPHRLPGPVESAAYFAVVECLANVVKHARATQVQLTGGYDGHRLRIAVTDDGVGGADRAGSGLAGVARRLAAFDGELMVSSPHGGPTAVTMSIPCEPR